MDAWDTSDVLDALVGQTIQVKKKSYRLLEKIAKGGLGCVFKVQAIAQPNSNKFYALKVALPDEDDQEWLKEEMQHAALDHPMLVKIITGDVFRDGMLERSCVLMEWVDGLTLDKWYRMYGMSLKQLCEFLCSSLELLRYLKDRNLIYNDLKPFNILVTNPNQYKWVDLASIKNLGDFCERMTTVAVAPEVGCLAALFPRISEKTEIYSLAACVHVMFLEDNISEGLRLEWLKKTYQDPDYYKDHPKGFRDFYLYAEKHWYRGLELLQPLLGSMLNLDPDKRPTIDMALKQVQMILQTASAGLLNAKVEVHCTPLV